MEARFSTIDGLLVKLSRFFMVGRKKIVLNIKQHLQEIQKYTFIAEEEARKNKQSVVEMEKKLIELIKYTATVEEEAQKNKQSVVEMGEKLSESQNHVKRFGLVSDALKAPPNTNSFVNEFDRLIKIDFKQFCDKESAINDVKEIERLEYINKEMHLIANHPQIHSKNMGAIGGGFSSGKSSFINSFITDSNIRLPIGIRPVTAIPSYIICNEKNELYGISYRGGKFEIAPEIYKSLSHEFLKSFSFNLREIILQTVVSCPMKKDYFENICLVDTPGYDSADENISKYDFETALLHIKDTNFLVWVIGLDKTGTIPESDLNFLNELSNLNDKISCNCQFSPC
jgi:hypothetical protein